ncbi:hypothetical protein CR513_23192, partial [Mucuna pruriens]
MKELGITIPFNTYEVDVLRTLGVALTQLHPNGWAMMQAFKVVCHCLRIKPIAFLLLCHYTTQIGAKAGWISLSPFPKTNLFNAYSSSYKGFKAHFVKIKALGGVSFDDDKKRLPLYWRLPQKFKGVPSKLPYSIGEDELHHGVNCKELVAMAFEPKPISFFKGKYPYCDLNYDEAKITRSYYWFEIRSRIHLLDGTGYAESEPRNQSSRSFGHGVKYRKKGLSIQRPLGVSGMIMKVDYPIGVLTWNDLNGERSEDYPLGVQTRDDLNGEAWTIY